MDADGKRAAPDGEYDRFKVGQLWLDNRKQHINAHHGGIVFAEGAYHWLGTHCSDLPAGVKYPPSAGNLTEVGVLCYSSKDLYNWKYEGVALPVSEDPGHDMFKGLRIERAKVVYSDATHQYVMWFHYVQSGKTHQESYEAAVATASTVTGPYTYLRKFRPDGGQMCRDCTLFKDDDGKVYFIYASEDNKALRISLLTPDCTDTSGRSARAFVGHYREAPALFKKDGRYHMITSGCTSWKPNAAQHAVATNVLGPWQSTGNPCIGERADTTFNSQGSFVLPVHGRTGAFIFMADRWNTRKLSDSRHIWLPVRFVANDRIAIEYRDEWDLSIFDALM
ncbi:MAG TPA: family 43 glycosylhydrolase [Candidatus Hydrogenedentes bacterium]|nr:family 43 glycosylhydrolase [Candidatus Hydrogenedentota bacterium]HIJ73309.1 family 43 glycosylhydrolase [Candidatus Hydrogenedentota bacterium]